MGRKKLQPEEIRERLIRLRNVEMLYGRQKKRTQRREEENKQLKIVVNEQAKRIEALLVRIEVLERMVFGQKSSKRNMGERGDNADNEGREKKERASSSYQRKIPKEVDEEEYIEVRECSTCHGNLEKKEVHEQYLEDIVLPCVEEKAKTKHIRKEVVEKGWCKKCQRWSTGKALQPHRVMLGPNVKALILFALYILGLSVEQSKAMLRGMYDFEVSDGEITNISERSKQQVLPRYQELLERIRGQPGNHMDETSWQEGAEKNYAWVMTGTESEEAVFLVGKSRGKLVAEELRGDSTSTVVSDGYGAYKNLASRHQQCWAHFQRTARDLKNSPSLSEKKRKRSESVYKEIASIYTSLRTFCTQTFDPKKGRSLKHALLNRIKTLVKPHLKDPYKLSTLKKHLNHNKHALFTCLEFPTIPPDNNKAERKLRHLVLLRKKSFGTKTQKGSHAFSINMSVLMSLWSTHPPSWFSQVHSILST